MCMSVHVCIYVSVYICVSECIMYICITSRLWMCVHLLIVISVSLCLCMSYVSVNLCMYLLAYVSMTSGVYAYGYYCVSL